MADFANYELSEDLSVYELADGLLPEIAEAAGFELTPVPDQQNIGELIGKVGPDKELQKNIGAVKEALGAEAKDQIADWIERSGILYPVERSFVHDAPLPDEIDTIIWSGGVANWMLRRAAMTQRFDPETVGQVVLPIGSREMKPGEHQLVKTYERREGKLPTEADFAREYIVGGLTLAGFAVELTPIDDKDGDEILRALFARCPIFLDGTITVVSNAPNAIQAAGQLRVAARNASKRFDSTGEQLFMVSDSIPLARRGEAAKTHQNPETALGQLVRNALFLERNRA